MTEVKELKEVKTTVKKVESKPLNIFQKMSAITNEIGIVAKNLKVSISKTGSYKAVSEGDILNAVKPIEEKYGVYSYPYNRTILESAELISYTADGVEKKNLFERIEVIYRFVNIDNPNEFIDVKSYGDGIDSGDKSVGKAMTYADKYALMKAYKIETGDDPDADSSEALKSKKNVLSPMLLIKANELNISLDSVATYFKKTVDTLTDSDLQACITMKENRNAKKSNIQ